MRDSASQEDPPWNLQMELPTPNTPVKVLGAQRRRSPSALAIEVFEAHLGSHILQVPLKEKEACLYFTKNNPLLVFSIFSFSYVYDCCYFILEF